MTEPLTPKPKKKGLGFLYAVGTGFLLLLVFASTAYSERESIKLIEPMQRELAAPMPQR